MNQSNPQWRRGYRQARATRDEFERWERRETILDHVRTIALIVLAVAIVYGCAAVYTSVQQLMQYAPHTLR